MEREQHIDAPTEEDMARETDRQAQFADIKAELAVLAPKLKDQEAKQLADAQATIAALQARVRELEAEGVKLFEWRLALHSLTPGGSEFCAPNACEEWVRKHRESQHEHLIEQIKQRKDLQSQLTQRTAELEAAKLVNDTHMKTVMKLSSIIESMQADLARVTAELEAAKRDRDELQSVFDLGHTRTVEADKLWQDAHGKPEVWPDLGDLVGWLIKRHDDVQAELERVRGELATYKETKHDAI